jgi:L,D-peptidoglycan transpeptidase YkuD (ErfK/YbiS/YcfS/YnhG family)
MSVSRVVGGCAASLAVAGCAILAVNMGRAAGEPHAASTPAAPSRTAAPRPAYLPMSPAVTSVGSSSVAVRPTSAAARPTTSHPAPASPSPVRATPSPSTRAVTVHRPAGPATTTTAAPEPATTPVPRTAAAPRPAVRAATGQALPLGYSTGTATRVITVTARSTRSTTATLQAWTKAAGGGWRKYGLAATAHVGADGLSRSPSEYRSATPMGTFTLTQAFGHYTDPGTALPYLHTTPSDWWISQPGRLYNTHQRCSSGCPFTRGDPNEHLYYEMPYYGYAVVIDYNTRNAPGGVRQGAGSAFFLHVTDGRATAGCVAIGQSKLVSLMRWLTPSAHPRILIGVS